MTLWIIIVVLAMILPMETLRNALVGAFGPMVPHLHAIPSGTRSPVGRPPRSALVEAAVVLPLILTALLGLVGCLQWGIWKLAAGAGAHVLAEGHGPTQVEDTTGSRCLFYIGLTVIGSEQGGTIHLVEEGP